MNAWRTDNKVWMEEREKTWKKIEYQLRYETFPKAELNQCRTYYLTGALQKNKSLVELVERLWMHPAQNEEAWGCVCNEATADDILMVIDRILDRSRHCYMVGIDGPLLRFLLGNDVSKGIIRFKGEQKSIVLKTFFDMWRRRAFLWLNQPYDADDCYCPYTTDFFFMLLTQMPPEFFSLEIKDRKDVFPDHQLMALRREVTQCHKLFYYILWFVEPRGLKGEDTRVRRFAETMRLEMENRELPSHVRDLWEYLKTDEARFLFPEWTENQYTGEYWSLVHHQVCPVKDPLSTIRNIHQVFEDLEFTHAPFDPEKVETVELKKHLTAKFSRILGFEKGDSIPGYRYRIQTTDAFVNSPSPNDSIDMDVIIFSHPKGFEFTENTPVAMLVPRPLRNYYYSSKYYYKFDIYLLNYRMVWRTLSAQYNLSFKRYKKFEGDEENRWQYDAEPHVDVSYFPLKSNTKALLNTPKSDFSILKDSPLPPLA